MKPGPTTAKLRKLARAKLGPHFRFLQVKRCSECGANEPMPGTVALVAQAYHLPPRSIRVDGETFEEAAAMMEAALATLPDKGW